MDGPVDGSRPRRRPSFSPVLLFVAFLVATFLFALTRLDAGTEPEGSGQATPGAVPEATLEPVRAVPPGGGEAEDAADETRPRLELRERERIRTHLAAVEAELRGADTGHLTAEQRRNRARHLDVLRAYVERGEFPRNLYHPGQRVPYFVDDQGVHCAVGYLIHRDGGGALVRRIAETRNNATIAELAGDPELVAWLHEAGLTPDEAARIQPAYCGIRTQGDPSPYWCPPPPPEPESESGISAAYGTTSLAAVALGGLSVGLAAGLEPGTRSPWVGALGTASGVTGLGLGAYGLAEGGDARTLGALSAAVGLVSTYVGVRTLLDRAPDRLGSQRLEAEVDPTGVTLRIRH